MSFERFTSRVAVSGQLIAETGLHIGQGGSSLDPSASDSPVMRDAAGRPFIPGSSFKGAWRGYLESLTRGLGRETIWACDPLAAPCIPAKGTNGIEQIKKDAQAAAGNNPFLYDELVTNGVLQGSCTVCLLFGSPWLAAHVLIRDLFVLKDFWHSRTEKRDGVGIDRDTGTARHGIKYDFEVVPVATRFSFQLMVENAVPLAQGGATASTFGLIALGLRELEKGRVSVGGKTTRGLGGVRLQLDEIEVVGDEHAASCAGSGSHDFFDYLLQGQGRTLSAEGTKAYLALHAKEFLAVARQG